jgi:hypothetical protein
MYGYSWIDVVTGIYIFVHMELSHNIISGCTEEDRDTVRKSFTVRQGPVAPETTLTNL